MVITLPVARYVHPLLHVMAYCLLNLWRLHWDFGLVEAAHPRQATNFYGKVKWGIAVSVSIAYVGTMP